MEYYGLPTGIRDVQKEQFLAGFDNTRFEVNSGLNQPRISLGTIRPPYLKTVLPGCSTHNSGEGLL